MKKLLTPLITLGIIVVANAQNTPDKDLFLIQSLAKENINKVNARTSGGSIEITGIATGETRIEIYVRSNGGRETLTKEEIRRRLEQDYQLSVTVNGTGLDVVAKQNDRVDWKRALNISFKIFVRENVATNLHTSGGSISLSNLSADQNFSTSGGNLNLNYLMGKIHGRTSGGSINVANSGRELDLKTSGGSINVKNCTGYIKLATSGGSLNLNNLGGTVEAKTSGGSISGNSIKGQLNTHTSGGSINLKDMSGSLEASTSGGSMNVDMAELGTSLKLSNSGGNINLHIPSNQGLNLKLNANKINTGPLNNFSGKKADEEVIGTLNGGGIPVMVKAGSGRITVNFKP